MVRNRMFHSAIISQSYKQTLRRGLALGAALVFTCTIGAPVYAGDTVTLKLDDSQTAVHSTAPVESTIKVPATQSSTGPQPTVGGASAVLMDAETGQVLYAKNPHTHRPNASTTKMMTGILIIENCGMNDIITASKNASLTPYTSLNLRPGEKITAKDLLTGMLVRSANDAAVAAAEHIGGTVPKFAAMMNKKAAEIGCKDTNFVTPNGLYDPNHYSSAYDLCLIARYAMRYPVFNDAVKTLRYTLSSRTINKKDMVVISKTKFLKNYPGADGVKSGYIKQARYCYVGSATRDGWRLVSAVLRSENCGNDTVALMDYGFANYQPITVAKTGTDKVDVQVNGGDKEKITATPARDVHVVVPKTGAEVTKSVEFADITAPVAKGAKLGTMHVSVNGEQVASVDLRAAEDVQISFGRRAWGIIRVCGVFAACLVVGGKYGRTFTKGSRRRRRRVTSSLRDFNYNRKSNS